MGVRHHGLNVSQIIMCICLVEATLGQIMQCFLCLEREQPNR